jgi:hypothetical protein
MGLLNIIKYFCKNFKCKSSCSLNDEDIEVKKYIKKMKIEEIKLMIENYKELLNTKEVVKRSTNAVVITNL